MRLPWTAAIVAALVGWAAPASAYRCSRVGATIGPSLVWESRRVGWWLSETLTLDQADRLAVLAQIRASFAEWERPDCTDLELAFEGTVAGLEAGSSREGPNRNAVVFVADGWHYDPSIIALTTSAYDPQSGVLYDADIELNDQSFSFIDATASCTTAPKMMDLQNTLTHEVGHLIGLDHPPSSPANEGTTMFASAPPCETQKRDLGPDDVAGLCAIYPRGAAAQQCFSPDGPSFVVISSDPGLGGCSAGGRGGGLGLLPLLLVLLWRRR